MTYAPSKQMEGLLQEIGQLMAYDPIKQLEELLKPATPPPAEITFPTIISRPLETLPIENTKRRWLLEAALGLRKLVIGCFETWFRTVLTGCVAGLIIGFLYRAVFLSN